MFADSNSMQYDIPGVIWNPECSPPCPLPSQLHIAVTPKGPIIAADGTEVELTCALDTTGSNPPWLDNVNFTWELNSTLAPSWHQYRSATNASVLAFNMSVLAEGSYRCVAAFSDPDYAIIEMSTDVQVELPSKYWGQLR